MSASAGLRQALSERVVVADGAMGTMLQAANLTIDDFDGHEGCNEILNVTRPDVVRSVHDAYFAVGVDCVETNTFGANWANLGEYGIADRIVCCPKPALGWPGRLPTDGPRRTALGGYWARSVRGRSCPRSATSGSTCCATRTARRSTG